MKNRFGLKCFSQFIGTLFFISFPGCAVAAPDKPESTYPNVVRAEMPDGWRVGSESHNAAMRILEFVPPDQTVDRWDEMLTMVVIYHRSGADLLDYVNKMREDFPRGCAVPPVLSKPLRRTDHGYDSITQTVACGKTNKYGLGEAMTQKVMIGQNAIFDVQRAWRFPAAPRSEDLPFFDAQRAAGAAYLDAVWLCDVTVKSADCSQ
jgi:hypothetical protein